MPGLGRILIEKMGKEGENVEPYFCPDRAILTEEKFTEREICGCELHKALL